MDLPAGYTSRPATMDDAAAVLALGLAVDVEEYGEPDWDLSDVVDDWTRPRFDLATDTWLVHGPDGSLAAYARTWDKQPHTLVTADVLVHPDAPDLYPWTVDVVSRRSAEHAAVAGTTTTHSFNSEPNARRAAALRAAGYEVCRVFRRMVADLAEPPPAPAPGPGVVIRPATTDDHPLVYELNRDSFVDHFDHYDESYDAWHGTQVGSDSYRPEYWWIAEVDGEPAAFLIGQRHEDAGWVKTLGTLKSARGRGAGTALMLTAFHAFRADGLPSVGLGVDSDNTTGAMALYERVGMRAAQRYDCYERVFTSS